MRLFLLLCHCPDRCSHRCLLLRYRNGAAVKQAAHIVSFTRLKTGRIQALWKCWQRSGPTFRADRMCTSPETKKTGCLECSRVAQNKKHKPLLRCTSSGNGQVMRAKALGWALVPDLVPDPSSWWVLSCQERGRLDPRDLCSQSLRVLSLSRSSSRPHHVSVAVTTHAVAEGTDACSFADALRHLPTRPGLSVRLISLDRIKS